MKSSTGSLVGSWAYRVRRWRVFSKTMAVFITVKLSEALQWVYSLDLSTLTPEAVALVTALLTSLTALVKFTYTFASHESVKEDELIQAEIKEKRKEE